MAVIPSPCQLRQSEFTCALQCSPATFKNPSPCDPDDAALLNILVSEANWLCSPMWAPGNPGVGTVALNVDGLAISRAPMRTGVRYRPGTGSG